MPIIRRRLQASTVYPDDLRYSLDTDTVQKNVNGEWKDAPDADPRHQTTIPARTTGDAACNAAQSVADAFSGQIDQILTAIDNSASGFTLAGIILALFEFGPWGVFISLALYIVDQMLTAGTTALSAALTGAAWQTFKCILFCQFDSNGRLKPGAMAVIVSQVNDQIGGLGATIINLMLKLAGDGGVNNIAALGTATGDCSACDPCGTPCGDQWAVSGNAIYLGRFAGYDRYRAQPYAGTMNLTITTSDAAKCCKLLDWRYVGTGSETVVAQYHINCGNPIDGAYIANGWTLEGCYDWLAAQAATGDATTVFEAEFLFVNC